MKDFLIRLTGGRPMRFLSYAFTDVVSGQRVSYWRDRLGRKWMAEGAWSLFRVPARSEGINLWDIEFQADRLVFKGPDGATSELTFDETFAALHSTPDKE